LRHYCHVDWNGIVVFVAYHDGGHTQTAMADVTGLSVSRVSRIIAGLEAKY
jgi:DNA-binding MarR family transcriptional regulator